MSGKVPFRPWGELKWALGLSTPRRWRFLGCIAAEERSISGLIALQQLGALESVEMLRIIDTEPADSATEEGIIKKRLTTCEEAQCKVQLTTAPLDAPLQNSEWKRRLSFPDETSLCLDISSLPKRFFFSAIKSALNSPTVRDFLILYTKPTSYPDGSLSENPKDWSTITGFDCVDPDNQALAASKLIVGAGFAVDGLHEHLEGRGNQMGVDVLIPFPAEPWASVRRSWDSAREIEEALGADPDTGLSEIKPAHHRVGALDTSTAFDRLRSLTEHGLRAAALAPLGPKPISVAMCLLSSQTDLHPVYYAQPRTYALNYSSGSKITYAYWIKHQGVNFYTL